jgi:hypothetical protein
MGEVYKRLGQGYFASSAAKLYDVPSSTEAVIKTINVSNNTGTAREVTLYHCDNGDTPDNEQIILPGVEILAGGFAEFEGTICMAALTELHGFAASAGDITYTIWGLEIS